MKFTELGLIVKFGPKVSTSEAISLWFVRKAFHGQIPVPEVYGWRTLTRENLSPQVFIYMHLIPGPTLEQRWDSMTWDDKQSVYNDLQVIVSQYRKAKQDESEKMIGKLDS